MLGGRLLATSASLMPAFQLSRAKASGPSKSSSISVHQRNPSIKDCAAHDKKKPQERGYKS